MLLASRTLRLAAPAQVLAVALLVPWLDKAHTIDDTLFLRQAEHALVDPLHPSALEIVWTDEPERLSRIMPSGPVMAWLLAPIVRAGAAERVVHLEQLALVLLLLHATAAIAARLRLDDARARLVALLVVATPPVMAIATTAMPDVAAAALAALAVERLLAWRDERRAHQAASWAVALALAAHARSHSLLLAGVGALLLVEREALAGSGRAAWRRLVRRDGAVIAAPVALALALVPLLRDPAASSVAGAASALSTGRFLDRNLLAFFAHWLLVVPFGAAWLALRRGRSAWLAAGVALPVAVVLLFATGEPHRAWIVPVACVGVAVLVDVAREGLRRRDPEHLALAAWLLVALPIAIYAHLPSKYLTVSAPAAAILLARALPESGRLRAVLPALCIAWGVGLGQLVIAADAAISGLQRRAVAELIAPRVAAGERVWFAGHWGFQWYAERAGARIVTRSPPAPAAGDVVVVDRVSLLQLEPVVRALRLGPPEASLVEDRPGGRVMSAPDGAAFYSNAWGYLPWWWGRGDLDRVEVRRVLPDR